MTATVTFTSGTSSSPTSSPSDMQRIAKSTVRDLLQNIATETKIKLTVEFENDLTPNAAAFGAETAFTFTVPLTQCLNRLKKRGLPLYRTGHCSGSVVIGKEKGVVYGADGKQLYRQT
ncbi:hypothetical protein GYMLUDRAFT_49918 [Collybiopsis luxurians FD-317 M1]|uniref:Uncharacterized protein n=1 Tax=Collybiopsis luxurians FD-317 M1 TaxID=944289 RepID=A0A0D0BD47_9AGAR|nr:hypothetical protein GYMLUDRAFT_49918 [Collybiopsis luxurians FD-317 M1]